MGKKFMGSPSYSGVYNSDIVLDDDGSDKLTESAMGNTDWNAVLAALQRTDLPRIVELSAHNWGINMPTVVTFAADDNDRYHLTYPTAGTKGIEVSLEKIIGGVVPAGHTDCGNGYAVYINEIGGQEGGGGNTQN